MAAAEPLPLPPAPDELDESAQRWVDGDDDSAPPAFLLSEAHRYAGARARVQRRIEDITAQHRRHVEQADAWRDARLKPLLAAAGRLDLALSALLYAHREGNPRSKTLQCPYGVRVSQRTVPARWTRPTGAEPERLLVAHLKARAPEFVRVKEEAAWSDLTRDLQETPDGRAMLRTTGEVLPEALGLKLEPAHESEPKVEVSTRE